MRLEASFATFLLKVAETSVLWPEERMRAGAEVVCHDHVEPMRWVVPQRLQRGVRDRVCAAAGPTCRLRQGVPCAPAVGGPRQALHLGVRGLRPAPDEKDAVQACVPDPRRKRLADVAVLFAHVRAANTWWRSDNVVWVGAAKINRRKAHNSLIEFTDMIAERVHIAKLGKVTSVWEAFAAEFLLHNG